MSELEVLFYRFREFEIQDYRSLSRSNWSYISASLPLCWIRQSILLTHQSWLWSIQDVTARLYNWLIVWLHLVMPPESDFHLIRTQRSPTGLLLCFLQTCLLIEIRSFLHVMGGTLLVELPTSFLRDRSQESDWVLEGPFSIYCFLCYCRRIQPTKM